MTYKANFHGGLRDGTSRELDVTHPPVDIYLDHDEVDPDEVEVSGSVEPGQPYPTIPNSRYTLRNGDISDGLHYDWVAASNAGHS